MDKERDTNRQLDINDLITKLEIRRCMIMDYEDIDDDSLEVAKDSQERIWKLIKEQSDLLPFIINELVYKGSYFESMAFAPVVDKEMYEKDDFLQDEIDNLWTSQMLGETLVGIGEIAIPYLIDFDNDFSKKSIKKIQDKYLNK